MSNDLDFFSPFIVQSFVLLILLKPKTFHLLVIVTLICYEQISDPIARFDNYYLFICQVLDVLIQQGLRVLHSFTTYNILYERSKLCIMGKRRTPVNKKLYYH